MTNRLLILPLLALCLSAGAQQTDIFDQLQAHPEYLSGTDYLCPTGPVELTRAPKGYEPFYISHYGRHGARYAWQSDIYDKIHDVFGAAAESDNLTALGASFKERFDGLYPSVRYRVGDLSRKGWQQQQELAGRMYANFPKVFGKDAAVRAWTSTSTRCVMTMSAFCLGLKAQDAKLDIFENFGVSFLPAILPLDGKNPFRNDNYLRTPLRFGETWEQYVERTVDWRAILGRLFKEPFKAVPEAEGWDFVSYLYFFAGGMDGIDTDLNFTDIFTPEERVALWKVDDFQFYANAWPTHLGYQPIVEDIIARADERIAGGERGADLRFGHDYTFLPLLMTLDVNGFGHDVADPDEIPVWCQLHEVPMGANLQFVFYRSKRSPKVLFKVLLNGREARLPLPADNWPYYDWDAFKQQAALPVMGDYTTVDTQVPEVSGLCLAPDGDGMLAASDEKGVYAVSWTGETKPFFVERHMDCEGVTIDPATRDVYYVVEGRQEIRRLRAPEYKESELLGVIKEAGYRTNSGLEAITWMNDGTLLVGNQADPRLLIRFSPTEGILDRIEITEGIEDISGLCYDPVRNALWIPDSELRTVNLCTLKGKVIASYPVPFIDNGESLYVDRDRQCIWVGDDTTSKLYKISFKNL
ncbi:MAG: hypothetical protein IKQ76_02950 [Bacteroidales bacterium]|nr:hypothetical protein [Bacteroidales bacterium]